MHEYLEGVRRRITLDWCPRWIYENVKKQIYEQLRFSNTNSYSQEGEDLILRRFFGERNNGFYVDVGAHHPRRFSNTFMFYNIGWRGINIEATPGTMTAFQMERPDDINIECAISDTAEIKKFYIFNEPALNTFDGDMAKKIEKENNNYKIVEVVELQTRSLTEVVLDNLPQGVNIDFITIDVEGYDHRVLRSLDLEMFRPDFVLIEERHKNIEQILSSANNSHMKDNGYELVSRTFFTSIYRTV